MAHLSSGFSAITDGAVALAVDHVVNINARVVSQHKQHLLLLVYASQYSPVSPPRQELLGGFYSFFTFDLGKTLDAFHELWV